MAEFRVGIMGTGNIASQMAVALNGLHAADSEICSFAVASRTQEKADEFAAKWHFQKAYGTYEELAADPEIDLIYVATPHAMHYENARLCLEHGKNVLVEKAFTANAKQARELLRLSEEKKLFLTEAIWTRYMPSRQIVVNLLEQGIIGEVTSLKATFNTPNFAIRRMHDPALAGGALLDLGMYTLTFASMFFGNDVERMESRCRKYKTGVDATDHIRLFYRDGKKAELMTSMTHLPKCEGILYGSRGKIRIQNINNFSRISVYEKKTRSWNDYEPPKQINGYEYEILACKRAIEAGQIECEEMPHTETLCMMQWMDELRGQWGIVYPFE